MLASGSLRKITSLGCGFSLGPCANADASTATDACIKVPEVEVTDDNGLSEQLFNIYQSLEVEVSGGEKTDNDGLTEQLCNIYQSLDIEASGSQKRDKSTLNRKMLDQLQALADEGLIDSFFIMCHSLKEDNIHPFFLDLVPTYLSDLRTVIRDIAKALESSVVDFDVLHQHYIKLKGSSSCIGACKITKLCPGFKKAVDKKSKDECMRAVRIFEREYHVLQSKLKSIIELEKEIVSGESSQS